MENSCEEYYISEKFFDCFLNNCVPVYYGCSKIKEAYNKDAFITFEPRSDNIINELKDIMDEPISWRLPAILQCKKDYFGRYNLLKYLQKFIKQLNK